MGRITSRTNSFLERTHERTLELENEALKDKNATLTKQHARSLQENLTLKNKYHILEGEYYKLLFKLNNLNNKIKQHDRHIKDMLPECMKVFLENLISVSSFGVPEPYTPRPTQSVQPSIVNGNVVSPKNQNRLQSAQSEDIVSTHSSLTNTHADDEEEEEEEEEEENNERNVNSYSRNKTKTAEEDEANNEEEGNLNEEEESNVNGQEESNVNWEDDRGLSRISEENSHLLEPLSPTDSHDSLKLKAFAIQEDSGESQSPARDSLNETNVSTSVLASMSLNRIENDLEDFDTSINNSLINGYVTRRSKKFAEGRPVKTMDEVTLTPEKSQYTSNNKSNITNKSRIEATPSVIDQSSVNSSNAENISPIVDEMSSSKSYDLGASHSSTLKQSRLSHTSFQTSTPISPIFRKTRGAKRILSDSEPENSTLNNTDRSKYVTKRRGLTNESYTPRKTRDGSPINKAISKGKRPVLKVILERLNIEEIISESPVKDIVNVKIKIEKPDTSKKTNTGKSPTKAQNQISSPIITSARPRRAATPLDLKEPSTKKKMRR